MRCIRLEEETDAVARIYSFSGIENGYLIYFDRVSEEEMLLASQKSFCVTMRIWKDYSKMYQEKVNIRTGHKADR